jgi:hypothetical protein
MQIRGNDRRAEGTAYTHGQKNRQRTFCCLHLQVSFARSVGTLTPPTNLSDPFMSTPDILHANGIVPLPVSRNRTSGKRRLPQLEDQPARIKRERHAEGTDEDPDVEEARVLKVGPPAVTTDPAC